MITPDKPDIDDIMAETLWHIDAELEVRGWDQSAELYAVMVHPLPPEAHLELGVVELRPIPGWERCLDQAPNPEEALTILCALFGEAPAGILRDAYPPASLYGAVIAVEAWANQAEYRFIYCVSRQGRVSALNHERDGIVQAYDGTTGPGFDLRLPNLLARLLGEVPSE